MCRIKNGDNDFRIAIVTNRGRNFYTCRYSVDGRSYKCFNFEIFVGSNVIWKKDSWGGIPPGCINLGGTSDRYIGRSQENHWDIGTIDVYKGALYYSHYSKMFGAVWARNFIFNSIDTFRGLSNISTFAEGVGMGAGLGPGWVEDFLKNYEVLCWNN